MSESTTTDTEEISDPENRETAENPGSAAESSVAEPLFEEPPPSPLLEDRALLRSAAEALLFASPEALSLGRLAEALGGLPRDAVREALEDLAAAYDEENRGFRLVEVHGGFRLSTREDFAEYIINLSGRRRRPTLSGASLETLAIIAYRQPVIRATVDSIRGVESSGAIRNLVDMELVEIVGQKEVVGRPSLYATTTKFLEVLGLRALDDLPGIEILKEKMVQEERARADEERAAREKANAETWAAADAAAKARKEAMREEERAHNELIESIGKDLISGEDDDDKVVGAEGAEDSSDDPADVVDADDEIEAEEEFDEEDEFDDDDDEDEDDEDFSDELDEDEDEEEEEEEEEEEDDDDDDDDPSDELDEEDEEDDGDDGSGETEAVNAPPLKQISPPSPVNFADRIRATAAARNQTPPDDPRGSRG